MIRLLRERYAPLLENVNIDYDLSAYDGQMTVYDVQDCAEIIKEEMITLYQTAIEEKVNKTA